MLLRVLLLHHHLLLRHHLLLLAWGHLLVLVHTVAHHHVLSLLVPLLLLASWLIHVLVVATSATLSASSTSTLEVASAATSLVTSEVLLAILTLWSALHLTIVRLSHLHSTWSKLLTLFALTLYEIDELGNVVPLFFISLLLQVIFSLPEVDLKWLLVEVEAS